MAVNDIPRRAGPFTGNGVTTVFPFTFKVLAAEDVRVAVREDGTLAFVDLDPSTYTVAGAGEDEGGSVTLGAPLPSGDTLVILGDASYDQPLTLFNQGAYFAEDVMRALDRNTVLSQQLKEQVDRAVLSPVDTETSAGFTEQLFTARDEAVASASAASTSEDNAAASEGAAAGSASDANTAKEAAEAVIASADFQTVLGIEADITTVAGLSVEVGALGLRTVEIDALAARTAEIDALDAISADISTVAGVATEVAAIGPVAATIAAIDAQIITVAGIEAEVTQVAAFSGETEFVAQKYQGALAADPTVRTIDGSPIQVGDFYLNTGDGTVRVRNVSGWFAIEATDGNPVGTIQAFAVKTPPAGWLKANGAALSVAAFPDLAAAIYPGDTDNATAEYGFRFTDVNDPEGSRDITGPLFKLPDYRGEFLRGWDDGRGVDAGRVFGSSQLDQMQRITGSIVKTTGMGLLDSRIGVDGVTNNGALSATDHTGQRRDGANGSDNARAISFDSGDSPDARVSDTTDGETRSRNVAVLICIKAFDAVTDPSLLDAQEYIDAVALSQLSEPQVTDPDSEVFGTVSGQRLAQAVDANAPRWELINQTTISAAVASVEFTDLGEYRDIMLFAEAVEASANSNRGIRLGTDSTIFASGYGNATNTNRTIANITNAVLAARSNWAQVFNFNVDGSPKQIAIGTNDLGSAQTATSLNRTDPLTRIQLLLDGSGNLTAGTVYLYGRK